MPRQVQRFPRAEVAIGDTTGITDRRAEVFALAAQGLSNEEIACDLDISAKAVQRHIDALKDQFCAINRADLISQGWMHGILQARAMVRALVVFLMIISAGPAIRPTRTAPASRRGPTTSVRIGRREIASINAGA